MTSVLALKARAFAASNPRPTLAKGLFGQMLNEKLDPAVVLIESLWKGGSFPVDASKIANQIGLNVIVAPLHHARVVLLREKDQPGAIFLDSKLNAAQQRVVCARAIGQEILFMRGRGKVEYELDEIGFPNLDRVESIAARLLMPSAEWMKLNPVDPAGVALHFGVPIDFADQHFQWRATEAKTHEPRRTFIHLAEAHYRDSMLAANGVDFSDEVMLTATDIWGNTDGEIAIRWTDIGSQADGPAPYIHAFGDSWSALAGMGDVLSALAAMNHSRPTPQAVIQVLLRHGFKDATSRVSRSDTPSIDAEQHPAPRG